MKHKATTSRRTRIRQPEATFTIIDAPPKTPRERRQLAIDTAAMRLALRIMESRPLAGTARRHAAD